ncbi:MAG: sigma-70 family RNA polymerase sigma factor [Xanthomonadales bacterium]|jgi:RNA polymerase sigma factor (sigma-70 family)|nr:sigma-70 family RNA polymerase sigma factor [Xanthomonadales bacterium]
MHPDDEMTSRPSSFAIDVPDALLVRMRRGEHAAFEQVYRWFERPVFTLALRICGEREQAADVLQDTMLKVIARIGEFRGGRADRGGAGHPDGSPFWGWLRQIAINEALMALRRRRRSDDEDANNTEETDWVDDRTPPPPAAADAACLQRALDALPANTRTVLWLYHAEGYTHDEIAALMQRTPSFSKSQLARGTRRLRELLEPTALPLREAAHG